MLRVVRLFVMKTTTHLSVRFDSTLLEPKPNAQGVTHSSEHRPTLARGALGHGTAPLGSLERLGFVAQLSLAARTPEEALACACKTSVLWSPLAFFLRRDRELMLLRAYVPEEESDENLVKSVVNSMFLWIELAERVAQAPLYPQAVYLPALDKESRDQVRRTFSCPVHFDQHFVGVAFRAIDLQRENAAFDPRLFRLLNEYAEDRLADRESAATTSARLLQALRQLEDIADASAESLAAVLGMGVRTLHRRLRAENKSYRGVLEEFRMQRCLMQLQVASVSAKRIAFSLGFANPASFHRAFKRWTGCTVSDYRRDYAGRLLADRCTPSEGKEDRVAS